MNGKKMLALLLALLMVGTLFVGCAPAKPVTSENPKSSEASKTADANYEYKLPLSDKPIVVTWATVENWYPQASYESGLAVWEAIAKKTNIRIKWEVLPDAQYLTSMQTRLAAGVSLPDILRVPGGDPTQYGQQGLLIPMNDLIDKYGIHIKEYFKKYPVTGQIMRSGDGNYYGIAPIIIESSHLMSNYFCMRKDWLANLKLEVPKTTDEWVTVMKAFRDQDPNGDGKKNEIAWGGEPEYFAEAFGLHLWASAWQGGFFAGKDGKVYYQYTDPRMKDFLTFANMLYKEKLLDQDYGNPNAEVLQAKVTKNLVGSFNTWADFGMTWGLLLRKSIAKNAWFIPVPPPKGPKGDQSLEGYGSVDMGFASISKDSKNPEAALKIMDYMWSPEGRNFLAFGIEGKTYTMVDGKPVYTDYVLKNPQGLGASSVLRTVGAWPTIPWVQQTDSYVQQLQADPEWKDAPAKALGPFYVEPFPALLATKAEQEKLSVTLTDINTYRSENITKFILGQRPISEFDAFVTEINGMGLAEVLKIKQEQWDRTFKK